MFVSSLPLRKLLLVLASWIYANHAARTRIMAKQWRSTNSILHSHATLSMADNSTRSEIAAEVKNTHGQWVPKKHSKLLPFFLLALSPRPASAFTLSGSLVGGLLTVRSAQPEELQRKQRSSTVSMPMVQDSIRFIQWGEKALEEYPYDGWSPYDRETGYSSKTPSQFKGLIDNGAYPGTFRVMFTLPGKEDEPKTLELSQSQTMGVASFGAVKVGLPLGFTVVKEDGAVVINEVRNGGNVAAAGIRKGDIVRAISAADSNAAAAEDGPWWRFFYAFGLPTTMSPAEEGMIFLDRTTIEGFRAVLRNNFRVQGPRAEVVLVIERSDAAQQHEKPPAQNSVIGEEIIVRPGFLGLELDDVSMGRIGYVDEDGQAGRLGVRPGWRILELNRKNYTYQLLQSFKAGSEKYSITVTSKAVPRRYNLRYEEGDTSQRRRLANMKELQKSREGELEIMLAAVRELSQRSSTKPKLADVARQMDKFQDKNKGAQYYFHLNALSEVRRANNRLYHNEIAPSSVEQVPLEELPEMDLFHLPSGELDRNLRQKGPDGAEFVAPIADPTKPKSVYLKRLQQDLNDRDLLTRLDKSLEDFRGGLPNSMQITQTPSEEDFLSSLLLEGDIGDLREMAVNDRILISLGMQVVKRRRLGEPGLTARSLWSRIVARTDEVYQVAERMDASYHSVMKALLQRNGLDETAIVFGALKDPVRIYEKAIDDYSIGERNLGDGVLPEAWVDDVLRCTITVTNISKIVALQNDLQQLDGGSLPGDAGKWLVGGRAPARLRLVRSKNRFRNPGVTHFRYILNNFELCVGSQCVMCEMQVQQTNMRELDGKLDGHYHYTYFRAALERLIQKRLQKDSGAGAAGQNLDGEILARLEAYDELLKRLPWYGWDSWTEEEEDKTSSPSWFDDKLQKIIW